MKADPQDVRRDPWRFAVMRDCDGPARLWSRPHLVYRANMSAALFQIDPRDSVATALRDLDAGERQAGVIVAEPVARGHKVALRAIAAGEAVLKFGFPIGRATRDILRGGRVCSQP